MLQAGKEDIGVIADMSDVGLLVHARQVGAAALSLTAITFAFA